MLIQSIITVVLGLDLLLIALEGLRLPYCRKRLPLGGSHVAQIGILFGAIFGFWELFSIW